MTGVVREVDETYPRLLQAGFAGLVGFDVATHLWTGQAYQAGSWPALGLLVLVVATVGTALASGFPACAPVLRVVPLLDLASLGLLLLAPEPRGIGALVVLPALWLARRDGRRGAVTATVATVLLVSVPIVVHLGAGDPVALSRALVLPAVAALVAGSVAAALEVVRARSQEADERGVMLEAALSELRREARRSATVLDAVDAGTVLLDADGSYRAVNRRHRGFLTLAYPEGHRGSAGQEGDVFGVDRRTRLGREQMPSWRARLGEEFDDLRIWVGADPGTQRALSVTARAVRDADGRLEGSVLSYLDVTDLVRALEVKDDFVATVSHELRTPLTSIIGYLDVLQDDPGLDDRVRAHLDVVERNATRLLALVGDLLHPAAQAPGTMVLRRLPQELGALVREAVQAAGPAAHAAGLRLTADCPAPVPALVDRDRVVELLGHLLRNAVRYNRPGGEVAVALTTAGDPLEAVLEVRDTGVGIPVAERDQVFEPFVRGEHARVQAVQGVGLGLTIARSVAAAHGGRISVDSVPGGGTTVRVHLPLPGGRDLSAGRRRGTPVGGREG